MTPVRAALTTLVQCRSLWVWHVWGIAVCIPPLVVPMANPAYREGALTGMLLVPLWSGLMTASIYRDILSKPFSFGLPRHSAVWRRAMSSVGLVVAAACTMVFLLSQTGTPSAVAVSVWQALLWCLTVFAAGILTITVTPNPGFVPGVVMLLLFIVFSDNFGAYFRVSVERTLLASPLVTIVACALVVTGAWLRLGSRSFARRLCGEAFLPLHGIWSGNRQAAYIADRKVKLLRKTPGAAMMAIERFVLGRMRALSGHPTARSWWGTLYILGGKAAPSRASHLVLAVTGLMLLAVVLGFYHPKRFPEDVSGATFIMFLICALNADYRINPHAALMLNISRKIRFRSLMFAALVQTLVVCFLSAAIAAVSIAAGRFLHEVTLLNSTLTYDPIIPKTFFFFTPMIPFFYICQVWFPRNIALSITVVGVVAVVLVAANVQRLLAMGPLELALLQVVCWLPFVAVIRQHCFRRDLELDGP